MRGVDGVFGLDVVNVRRAVLLLDVVRGLDDAASRKQRLHMLFDAIVMLPDNPDTGA